MGEWSTCDSANGETNGSGGGGGGGGDGACTWAEQFVASSAPFTYAGHAAQPPPDGSAPPTDIHVAVGAAFLVDSYPSSYARHLLRSVGFAAELARRTVEADPTLLPGRALVLTPYETACNEETAFSAAQAAYDSLVPGGGTAGFSRLAAFVGPSCSSACEIAATYFKVARVPQLSHSCTADELTDGERYPYFNRVAGVDTEQVVMPLPASHPPPSTTTHAATLTRLSSLPSPLSTHLSAHSLLPSLLSSLLSSR